MDASRSLLHNLCVCDEDVSIVQDTLVKAQLGHQFGRHYKYASTLHLKLCGEALPEAIFLLLVPSTDREPVKSRGKGKKGKRKGTSSSNKGGKPTSLGTPGILSKSHNSRVESRPPVSKKRPTEVGATRGGPHLAPRLRPDQCMLCRQVGHRASECPNKGKPTAFSPGRCVFDTFAPGCAVFDSQCYGANVEEIEQDQDEEGIEDFVAFSIKSLEGFISVQPVADRYEGTTIESTDVGFTFAGGETELQTRTFAHHMPSSRKEFR